jgi:hypothetical protein
MSAQVNPQTVPGNAEARRLYPDLDQVLVRMMVLLGASTAMVAAQAAGARPSIWLQAVVAGLAVLTALRPESVAGTGLLVGTAYTWGLAPETLSPVVLIAAAGMVLVHVSALVAAQGPALVRVDPVQVRRWAVRGVFLWLAAAAVWGLSTGVVDLPHPRLTYATGLTVLIVLAVVATRKIGTGPHR